MIVCEPLSAVGVYSIARRARRYRATRPIRADQGC